MYEKEKGKVGIVKWAYPFSNSVKNLSAMLGLIFFGLLSGTAL